MKRSELKEFIKEEILSSLSEASMEDVNNQEKLNKELEKTVKLSKDLGLEESEDEEPTKSDLKKTKGLAKAKEELAQLTKQMKSLARDYKGAEGEAKEKIIADLKSKTKLKKELESLVFKL
tara:strand:+ start:636 stop:998 length:363 start_codon:yes stop_codon:yes gene_type:complete